MHKRFLSSIGRRPSRIPPEGFPHERSIAANQQKGQESEKAIPDGDSPEASVSRGVVSFVSTVNKDSRHSNVVKETVLRVWRPKYSGMALHASLYATFTC